MSLALRPKLAKLNQTCYPFLARELNKKFLTSVSLRNNVPEANTFAFVCPSRPANKQQTANRAPQSAQRSQLPPNHNYVPQLLLLYDRAPAHHSA
jgi:hypothetical protein